MEWEPPKALDKGPSVVLRNVKGGVHPRNSNLSQNNHQYPNHYYHPVANFIFANIDKACKTENGDTCKFLIYY